MEIHQVNGKQGLQWIISGFYLFMKAPLAWIVTCFTLIIIAIGVSLLPFIGKFIFTLISPIFLAGVMMGCKDMERGRPLQIMHLFSAFRINTASLVTVGGVYLIGQVLILGLVMLIGGSQMTDMLLYGKRVDESELMDVMSSFLTSSLIALALSIPLMMASWFSPLLIVFHDAPPVAALQRSFFACLKNFIPFQVYGIAFILLTLLSMATYGLGFIVLIPVMFTSIYVSYKDIFLAEPLRIQGNESNSENSETDRDNQQHHTTSHENGIQQQNTAVQGDQSQWSETNTQCAFCNASIQKDQAVADQGKFFCSEEHHKQYLSMQKPEN